MATWTKRTTPSALTSALLRARDARWSSDSRYLCVAGDTVNGTATGVTKSDYARVLRRNDDGTYTDLGALPSLPAGYNDPVSTLGGIAYGAAWSPADDHVAVGLFQTPFVHIYSRDGETFTKLSNPATLPAEQVQQVAFSRDNQFLACAHVNSPYITVYARSGSTYTKLTTAPDVLPTGNGISCAFSPDSQFLAVAHSTSPFVTVYAISGSGASATLTKLANPTGGLPASTGTGVAWSPDGTYLAVAALATPYIQVYKKSGSGASATLAKIANPASLPPGNVRELTWGPGGTDLYCSCDASPFHVLYGFNASTDTLTKRTDLDASAPTALTYAAVIDPGGDRLAIAGTGSPPLDLYDTDRRLVVTGGGDMTATGHGVIGEGTSVSGGGEMTATGQKLGWIRVAGATPGDEYRLYDSGSTLLATATVDANGIATLTRLASLLPVTGYVQGYSGGSPITGDRWPASGSESIHDDRVFLAAPENLSIAGLDVIAYDAANYYPTSQYGGSSSQIIETATYRFICYRSGGLGESTTPESAPGDVKIVRWNKSTGAIDQGPVTIRANQWNGHEPFVIARAPNGKLRFVYGGWRNGFHTSDANGDVWFRETTNADDITAWGSAVSIRDGHTVVIDRFEAFLYKVGSDGTNYIVGGTAGDDIEFGHAANGSTSWTWTTIGTARTTAGSRWGGLIGDMVIAPGTAPVRVGVCFGSYGLDETYEEAYRKTYYLESDDNFATATKADGSTAISLPFTWTSAGATSCELVQDGYHYGYWLKLAFWNGEPLILGDGDRQTFGDFDKVIRWTGSAWSSNDVPGLISNDTGFAIGAPSPSGPRFGNWGTSLLVAGSTIYVFSADRGDNSDAGFRLLRWSSPDGFATVSDLTVQDDDFSVWSYAELTDTTRSGAGVGGAGFCYPKIPEGYPNTVLFSVVDEADSTVLVADWTASGTVSVSGGGEMTATGQQTFGETVSVSGGGDMTATGALTSGGAEPAPVPLSPLSEVITASHTVAVLVEVLEDGEVAAELDTVIDGTVTLDQTAASRGRCDIAIVDDGTLGLIPTDPADQLAPYGNELRISRGVIHSDGTTEYVRLGVFRIDSAGVEDTGDQLAVRIAGLDRSARVIDARFEEPYQVAAGTNYADAILAVIQDAYPTVTYDLTATDRATPQLIAEEGGDRWAFAQDMAKAIGMSLYFDGDGTLVLRPVSSSTSTPVAVLAEGEDGLLVQASRAWSRQGAFNRVIATGENTGETTPARGVATDDNPLSPTYYYGQFGKVPRFYASPFITTDAQATDAAQAILARELGTTQSVDFGAIVDPTLKPDDVVTITRLRAGIDEAHILDSVTIPLTAEGAMTGKTRAIQVT